MPSVVRTAQIVANRPEVTASVAYAKALTPTSTSGSSSGAPSSSAFSGEERGVGGGTIGGGTDAAGATVDVPGVAALLRGGGAALEDGDGPGPTIAGRRWTPNAAVCTGGAALLEGACAASIGLAAGAPRRGGGAVASVARRVPGPGAPFCARLSMTNGTASATLVTAIYGASSVVGRAGEVRTRDTGTHGGIPPSLGARSNESSACRGRATASLAFLDMNRVLHFQRPWISASGGE
jgi:hypothetical protein